MIVRYPAPYIQFLRLFNDEEYWESHEVLEQPWRQNRSDFYQGLIIYASAFVHAQRGNPTGVRKQLEKTERYLTPFAPIYMGLDVDEILDHGRRCRARVDADPSLVGERLRAAIPFPRLHLDARRVRGDEPELFSEEQGGTDEKILPG